VIVNFKKNDLKLEEQNFFNNLFISNIETFDELEIEDNNLNYIFY
jgi:hypothetical protein